MKTDELITVLATQAGAVDPRATARRLQVAAIAGVVAALPWVIGQLGLNPDLVADARLPMFWIKVAFVAGTAAASGWLVQRLARPGAATRHAMQAAALPVLAIWALAVIVLVQAEPGVRTGLVLGESWDSCPWNIALLAVPVFVIVMATMRTLAPTHLRLAGAGVGLFAGALGALAYLLHCPELEAPFLAIWYVIGMLIPATLGALIGPRVLRW